jgi:hypothetical protein
MALREIPVPVPFAAGLDTKSDPKQAPVGRLLTCENAVFVKGSSLVKRNGYSSLTKTVTAAGTDYADAKALATRGAETVLLTDGLGYSYQESLGTWNQIGPVASVAMTDEALAHTGSNQTSPDAATNGGVTALAWEDSRGGVYWTLIEAVGGRVLRVPAQLDANGTRPRCLAVGGVLHIVYAVAGGGALYIAVVNPVEPTATVTPVLLTSDLDGSNPSFDAVPTTRTGTPALIAWVVAGGYRVGYIDVSGVLGSPVTGHPSVIDVTATVSAAGIACAYDTEGSTLYDVLVVHGEATGATINAYTGALVVGPTDGVTLADVVRLTVTFDSVTAPDDIAEGCAYVWLEASGATARDHLVATYVVELDSPTNEARAVMRGCGLASRGFRDSSGPAVWVAHDVAFYAVYLCLRPIVGGTSLCVARALPGGAYGLPDSSHLPSVEPDPDDPRVHRWCASWQQQLESGGTSAVFAEVGIRRVALDFDAVTAWQTAQLGRSLYIGSACPYRYDGDSIAEAGWHYAADDIATPSQGTSGALTALGSYLYRVIYEEIDAQGEVHRGPESVGTAVTLTGSNDSVTLAIPTYRITSRRRVRIGVFRSLQGDDSQLYRVSSLDPSATGANGYVANDPTVDTISFTDELSDALTAEREPAYTNGGIPTNDPTGHGTILTAGKNRLFYNDPSDPLLVRFTQELAEGYAAEIVNELAVKVDPYGGAITALAVMDDRLVVFKKTAIFAVSGPGPLRDPLADPSAGFSQAQLVTSDVGCTAPASIAVTPVGIVFQSAKGIYLLGRDMGVSYVGAPVEAFNAQQVTRATLIEDRTQIVFLCSTGKTLLFDYLFGQWSTYTNHTGLDAKIVAGTYHYLRSDGRVFRETVGEYRDDNSQIRMVLETAWIKLQGYLQGMSRFYHAKIIGELRSAHTIRVRHQTDYQNSWGPPNDVPWTTGSGDAYGEGDYGEGPYGGSPDEVYQWSIHLGETGQAIRFRFEDIAPVDTFGPSFEFSELLLLAGAKGNSVRPLAANRTR